MVLAGAADVTATAVRLLGESTLGSGSWGRNGERDKQGEDDAQGSHYDGG